MLAVVINEPEFAVIVATLGADANPVVQLEETVVLDFTLKVQKPPGAIALAAVQSELITTVPVGNAGEKLPEVTSASRLIVLPVLLNTLIIPCLGATKTRER